MTIALNSNNHSNYIMTAIIIIITSVVIISHNITTNNDYIDNKTNNINKLCVNNTNVNNSKCM